MKKHWRWVGFSLVAVGLIALWLLVSSNKKIRQKVEALLLEKFVNTKVQNLKEKAAVSKARAEDGKMAAEDAENVAKEVEEAISKQKEVLQKGFENKGMDADEIANRFNNLRI